MIATNSTAPTAAAKPHRLDPVEDARKDPVNFLLGHLQEIGTSYWLDADDRPCLEIKDDPHRTLHRLFDDDGRLSLRGRSFLRNQYRYATRQKLHLGDKDLAMLADYLSEESYKGGRKQHRAEPGRASDYNFEAVVAFANLLRPHADSDTGLGRRILDRLRKDAGDEKLKPTLAADPEKGTLTLHLRTADLWRAVNNPDIGDLVNADKVGLFRAINSFSRRLAELAPEFRKVGLEVELTHKDTGSWTTVTRFDAEFRPDATEVPRTEARVSSSSDESSEIIGKQGKGLQKTDDNRIAVEPETKPGT